MSDGPITAQWFFEIVGPLLAVGLAVIFLARARRSGTLSLTALVFFGAITMFWQEWYTDWGAYLRYNEHFHLMPWGTTFWTTPNKPWAVIASYGWFFAAGLPLIVWACTRVARRRAVARGAVFDGRVPLGVVAAVAGPLFWIGDILAEGLFTKLNWYQYTRTTGPAISSSSRGSFPVLYPAVLFVVWAIVTIWLLSQPGPDGLRPHERFMRVDRVRPGARRELARFAAMAVFLNVSFWFLLVFPSILVRVAFGSSSSLVP
jgi:hypothetical protein